jgi:HPt (histidine-containing phosphotransfer) domain-containing protein
MAESSPVDPAALERLERLGGPEFVRRLIGIFLTEGPKRVAAAEAAFGSRDGAGLAYAAHSLISSAANVGATGLAQLARETERAAERGEWEALAAPVAALPGAFAAVRAELERALAAPPTVRAPG